MARNPGAVRAMTARRGIGPACLAGAVLAWGLFAASRLLVAIPDAGGAVWAAPAWPWLAGAFLLAGAAVSVLFAAQKLYLARRGLGAVESSRLAALAWLPSLALLLIPAVEAWGALPGSLAFCQEAWPAFALGALALTAGLTRCHAPKAEQDDRLRRWAGPAVFCLALAAFGLSAHQVFLANQAGPLWGGDEPQYLYIAHSLAVDHDLDLYDQIMLRENIYFQSPGDMIGGHGRPSAGGIWLSKHMPGLPLLLSPFYAWSLRLGLNPRWPCALAMALCSAWLVWETFALARGLTGRDPASFGAAALLALCLPLLLYAPAVFPGVAGAAFGLASFRRVYFAGSWRGLLAAGLLAAYLPWLNERFILLSLLLGLYFMVRGHWQRPAALAAFGSPLLVSAGVMMSFLLPALGQRAAAGRFSRCGSFSQPEGRLAGVGRPVAGRRRGTFHLRPGLAGRPGRAGPAGRGAGQGGAVRPVFLPGRLAGGRPLCRMVGRAQSPLPLSAGRRAFSGPGSGCGACPGRSGLCGHGSGSGRGFALGVLAGVGPYPYGGRRRGGACLVFGAKPGLAPAKRAFPRPGCRSAGCGGRQLPWLRALPPRPCSGPWRPWPGWPGSSSPAKNPAR